MADTIKGGDDYNARLRFLTSQPEFAQLEQKMRGLLIAKFRDDYIAELPDGKFKEQSILTIHALSKVESDYTKGDRYRVETEDFIRANLQYPVIAGQPKEKALETINKFRSDIDERSESFDPIFREDYVFHLSRIADAAERAARGNSTGMFADKVYRVTEGFAGGSLRVLGQEELANSLETRYFPENPLFGQAFLSKVANPFPPPKIDKFDALETKAVRTDSQILIVETAIAKGFSVIILIAIVSVISIMASRAKARNRISNDPITNE